MRISDWSSDVCSSDLFVLSSQRFAGEGKLFRRRPHWGRHNHVGPLSSRSYGQPRSGEQFRESLFHRHRSADFVCAKTLGKSSGGCDLNLRLAPERRNPGLRSEEHTSELQSLMRISYAVFCLKKKN